MFLTLNVHLGYALAMVKLSDIAESCHVSMATVSRVLNDDSTLSVSKEARDAIVSTAKRLGYVPPRQRKGVRSEYTVLLSSKYIARPGFEESLRVRLNSMDNHNGLTFVCGEVSRCDAYIFIGDFSEDEIKAVAGDSRAVLLINNRERDDYTYDRIVVDYEESERMVVDYFLSRGLKDISYYGGVYDGGTFRIGHRRLEGFKKILSDFGLYKEENFHISRMDSYSAYHSMMLSERVSEALIFSNNEYAYGALRALRDRGLERTCCVYQDFETVSYDLGINVLDIYSDELWNTAEKMLSEKIQGTRSISVTLRIPGKLITI